jgi:hypothetical protein
MRVAFIAPKQFPSNTTRTILEPAKPPIAKVRKH